MPGKLLSFYTIDKLIVSETASTAGGHSSLDYIPGSAILGAVAAHLYKRLDDPELQWLVFHSGKVRFGNAYPANHEAALSWPMPLSLHAPKNSQAINQGQLNAGTVIDLSSDKGAEDVQYRQLRTGYVNATGLMSECEKSYQLKTAINYHSGTAKDSQLFGYEAIESDQWFCGQLTWDNDVEAEAKHVIDAVLEVLDQPNLRIGRSRGAEFGRVKIAQIALPAQQAVASKSVTVYCVSDLALKSKSTGQPVLTLDAEQLGLSETQVRLRPADTFVRTRRYSTYNGARGAYDQERLVIAKGSVFSFDILANSDDVLKQLQSLTEQGLGLWKESGLGQISLSVRAPESLDVTGNQPFPVAEPVDTPLIHWLAKKAGVTSSQDSAYKIALKAIQDIEDQYKTGRLLSAIPAHQEWGPNGRAWAKVLDVTKSVSDQQAVMAKLFEGSNALIQTNVSQTKAGDPWQSEIVDGDGHYITMALWFKNYVSNNLSNRSEPLYLILQVIARQAMSLNIEWGGAQE